MKVQTGKLIIVSMLFGGMFLACNLFDPQPPSEQPSATPLQEELPDVPSPTVSPEQAQGEGEEVATVVALTLEAAATNTSEVPTPTPTNTNTPEPPTPTATVTEMPSPTLSSEDPKNSLGAYDWQDAFNSGANWTLYDEDDFKSEVKDGKYVMTKKSLEFGEVWEVSWPQVTDFYLEVTATTGACAGKDRYGLFFRAPDPAKGYLFGLSCDGQFRFASWDGSEYKVIVNWTSSPHIVAGANQTNRLGVMALKKNYTFYVNGVQVGTAVDSEFTGEGKFGFFIGAEKTADFSVQFDDLTYWDQ